MRLELDPNRQRETELTLETLQRERLYLKWLVADLKLDLLRREFARKGGFNPDQPRDELGQWTDAGTVSTDLSAARLKRAALEAYCLGQYARDMIVCRRVRLRACYAQAAERLANCLARKPIPPLNF